MAVTLGVGAVGVACGRDTIKGGVAVGRDARLGGVADD